MKKKELSAFSAIAILIISMCGAMPAPAASDSDEAIIRQQAADFARAFAAGDAKTIADQWLNDGTFVDENGNVYKGRSEIEAAYKKLFADHASEPIEVNIESITFPSSSVAIELGTTSLPKEGTASRYTAVHFKQDSGWMMSTVAEASIDVTTSQNVNDLSWLIGDWTAEGAKGKTHLKSSWDTNHHFIYCSFLADDGSTESCQIIGFYEPLQCITSWHFGSKGGHGRSIWMRKGNDWLAHGNSTEADGQIATATYILHPVDANTFTWKSVERTKDGKHIPDSTEVKVTRRI